MPGPLAVWNPAQNAGGRVEGLPARTTIVAPMLSGIPTPLKHACIEVSLGPSLMLIQLDAKQYVNSEVVDLRHQNGFDLVDLRLPLSLM